ncbi:MAG: succinate dehydrogenase cytochrome b subunit [Proteobacteria bacterium]|nr:MAG: succinate dehydrogenase cytochrome b subunit [Pseudomonadota bacterium]
MFLEIRTVIEQKKNLILLTQHLSIFYRKLRNINILDIENASHFKAFLQKSSLGSKYIMALTGAGLFAFLVGHIAGNLLLFFGQDAMNAYALGLRNLPYGLLWIARGGLIVIVVSHIVIAYRLTYHNRRARPQRYAYEATLQASFASRTMPYTGTLVLIFILLHLAHFTFRWAGVEIDLVDPLGRDDVYTMVVRAFQNPIYSAGYVVAMFILAYHLSHGLSSMWQSLGLNHRKYNPFFRRIMPLTGWVVCISAAIIPLAVLFGIIK